VIRATMSDGEPSSKKQKQDEAEKKRRSSKACDQASLARQKHFPSQGSTISLLQCRRTSMSSVDRPARLTRVAASRVQVQP
jgi:hypothetical protein